MFLYYALVFMSPFYHHPIFDRGFGSLTLVKLVGFACTLFAFFYLGVRGSLPSYLASRQARLFLAITLVAFISYAAHPSMREWSDEPAFSYLSFLVFFFITLTVADTVKKIWWTLMAGFAGLGFGALYLMREFLKYHALYAGFRPGTVVGDPNYYALAAMLVAPVAYLALMAQPRPPYAWAILATLAAVLVAWVLAASRGALIAMVPLCVFIGWRSRRHLRAFLLLGLLLIPPLFLLPNSPIKRIMNPGTAELISTASRVELWHGGLRMIKDKPLWGIGLGLFKPLVGTYAPNISQSHIAHDTYLELAAELGIPVLLAYLWLLLETYRALGRARRKAETSQQRLFYPLAAGLQAGLLAFAVGSFFISAQYIKLFWVCVFLSIPLERLATQEVQEEAKVATKRRRSDVIHSRVSKVHA